MKKIAMPPCLILHLRVGIPTGPSAGEQAGMNRKLLFPQVYTQAGTARSAKTQEKYTKRQ
ncbi:hypothetical protein [Bordetella trematum]|uniref:hypothetical protein n=1 Tax=Bordetella trematum TaxID=123899 RepID=UPI000F8F44D6|nr:hypothetical protein [Bordetella trematum]NNH17856.1 hypothetical protein [Bordetella trematum]QIM70331.1 hypothetical protein EYB34_02565 [Bordetella trematum]